MAAAGGYEAGKKIEGAYTFQYGTYVAPAKDELYQYAHDDKGDAYYNTYDGSAWSGWQGYENQPAPVAYDPAPVAYGNTSYVYYSGKDGYLYQQGWDDYGAATWDDVSGDYTYTPQPYASVYENTINPYSNNGNGNLYCARHHRAARSDTRARVKQSAAPTKSDSTPFPGRTTTTCSGRALTAMSTGIATPTPTSPGPAPGPGFLPLHLQGHPVRRWLRTRNVPLRLWGQRGRRTRLQRVRRQRLVRLERDRRRVDRNLPTQRIRL